jgi:uncharacterized protein (TIGR02265 family)
MDLKRARVLVEQEGPKAPRELRELLEHIDQTPKDHIVKGMYVGGILDTLKAHKVSRPMTSVQAFKDYPLRDYMELLLDSALTLYPRQGAAEGLRNLGRLAIPTFANSIIGGVVMGTVGRSWDLALKCVAKGYEVSLRPGKCLVSPLGPGHVIVQLRSVWNFGTSYQVGVIEGLMQWCHVSGRITPTALSRCNVDLKVEWEEKRAGRRRENGASASIAPPPL